MFTTITTLLSLTVIMIVEHHHFKLIPNWKSTAFTVGWIACLYQSCCTAGANFPHPQQIVPLNFIPPIKSTRIWNLHDYDNNNNLHEIHVTTNSVNRCAYPPNRAPVNFCDLIKGIETDLIGSPGVVHSHTCLVVSACARCSTCFS